MRHDTAGDPIPGVKWSRRTTRKIAQQLAALDIAVSKNTVGRLLKDMDFKLRVNRKQIASTKNPDRNQQFLYMGQQRERFACQGLPVIVDTKKKEQIGNFKNTGAKWDREPVLVRDHDFRSDADGMAIPYGIYDTQANRGAVFVGTSHDTPVQSQGRGLDREQDGRWRVSVEDTNDGGAATMTAKFVFIGAAAAPAVAAEVENPRRQRLWRIPRQRHLVALRRRRHK